MTKAKQPEPKITDEMVERALAVLSEYDVKIAIYYGDADKARATARRIIEEALA